MSVAFLFPGQGSQYPGMLHELPLEEPIVQQTVEEASLVLERDILTLDAEDQLDSTVAVQLCLIVAGVATARLLQQRGARPNMVAGHSVGAFSAAVIASVIPFKEAVNLVRRRGEYMEQAFPKGYGMGVILGIREKQLASIIDRIHTPSYPVYISNLNSPTQLTITGEDSAIERVFQEARTAGARRTCKLNVSVPSHCPLLNRIANELSNLLVHVELQKPTIPFAGNRTARPLRTAQTIREDLALSICNPVRWHDATSVLFELGARLYVELSPGNVLSNLASEAFPDAHAIDVSTTGLKNTVQIIKRYQSGY
ncbi:malonate decarboxylase subunit epsilon [Paenibacillus sp. 2KB_22]|uniref:malonate decarboxylase subunit epsilon n=1 Tax=Paenibacillus sp. 2KB_22 TaxID=3232978 RepID=UPI003F9BC5DB